MDIITQNMRPLMSGILREPFEMDQEAKPQKRALDSGDGPARKKGREEGPEDRVAFKILIPHMAVGAIIGKGGESMKQMKKDYDCIVCMSKTNDLYPGTKERICMITGTIANCTAVLRVIGEKIYKTCRDGQDTDSFDFPGVSRGTEMKVVMRRESAGIVIGKAGATIKEIRDKYDVNIQIHPKAGTPEAKITPERVLAIANEDQNNLIAACEAVLIKIASDPNHAKDIDREFSSNRMPQRPQSPYTSGGFQAAPGSSMGGYGYQNSSPYQQPNVQQQPLGAIGQRFTMNPSTMSNAELLSFLEQLQQVLRSSGFTDNAITEVMMALNVLAKYNIMALGLGFGVVAMAHTRAGKPYGVPGDGTQHGMGGGSGAFDSSFGSASGMPFGGWNR